MGGSGGVVEGVGVDAAGELVIGPVVVKAVGGFAGIPVEEEGGGFGGVCVPWAGDSFDAPRLGAVVEGAVVIEAGVSRLEDVANQIPATSTRQHAAMTRRSGFMKMFALRDEV